MTKSAAEEFMTRLNAINRYLFKIRALPSLPPADTIVSHISMLLHGSGDEITEIEKEKSHA